jgi:uncharacterized protein YdbL (DUF1318 family)
MMRRFLLAPVFALGLGLALAGGPALAQSAADKAAVDAAKAQGLVGEQGDGYLGLVRGSADPAVSQAMAAINAGRAQTYSGIASKTGVTSTAAGEATAQQLIGRVPPGQYYKPLGGAWTRK